MLHNWYRAIFSVAFVFLFMLPVRSAVISIDLGSEWMKVAVVNIKPGQSPISIAINEMSKRKSPSLVAFSNGDHLVGEAAAGIVARYPERVYSRLLDMVGKPFGEVKKLLDSEYLPYDIVEDDRGASSVRIDDGESLFSVEELLSMLLGYAKTLGESHAKSTIKDAVIAVPPYLGQTERECIIAAAELGGLNVLALVNQHAGAALQYGISKDFLNEPKHVIFYDMGANSAFAALVYYSAYTIKEFGKNVTINQFQVKEVSWDASLGGNKLELRLVDYFADLFNTQMGNQVDIRQFPKALAKLKKQVKRTKEILSANTEAILSVESLHDDHDFRSIITRKKFEELCEDIWKEALEPIKQVLKHSSVSIAQLHAVELIGGATRVPKLQSVLSEFLGKASLDRHLDADEAIALGAALHAANISDGIKMNRKLGMIDGVSYSLSAKFTDDQGQEKVEQIVNRMKKLPSKVFKPFKVSKDFKISLVYDNAMLPPRISSSNIATYEISGVTDAYLKYSSHNLTSPMKTNIHFSLSRSGVLSLDRGETVVEFSEWVEIPVKNLTGNETQPAVEKSRNSSEPEDKGQIDGSESVEENLATTPKAFNTVDKTDKEALKDSGSELKSSTEKKLRKRTIRVAHKIEDVSEGVVRPLPKNARAIARLRLDKINQQEEEKRRTAEAKNNLESYIYATKEKLDSIDGFKKVSTEEQRDYFQKDLIAAEDWLYDEEAVAADYVKRLETLKSAGESMFFRLSELEARPAAVKFADKYMNNLEQTVKGWESSKPWISNKSKEELIDSVNALRKWLSEKQLEQQKIQGHEDPVFTSDEVVAKVATVEEEFTKLSATLKPKPQVKQPSSKLNESSASTGEQDSESMETKDDVPSLEPEIKPSSEEDEGPHDEL